MKPNVLLAYDPGLGLQHPIMSMSGGRGGRLESERENTFGDGKRGTGVPPADIGDGGGGVTEGAYLRLLLPEHSCTVHYDKEHYGPVSGGGEAYMVMGDQAVVGSGRLGLGGDVDDGLGGKTDGQGEVDGQDGDKDRLNWWGVYCSKRNLKGGA